MEVYNSSYTAAELEYALGAVPSIGENGNWFIGDQDTGIYAGGVDVTGAEVGQFVKIASVDGDGRPTAWTPCGGGLDNLRVIQTITIEDGVTSFEITEDADGNPFSLTELYLYSASLNGGSNYHGIGLNGIAASDSRAFKVWHGSSSKQYDHRITSLGGGAAKSIAINGGSALKQCYLIPNALNGKDKIERISIWFAGGATAGETFTIYGR